MSNTFKFKEIPKLTKQHVHSIESIRNNNGLFQLLELGYSYDTPVEIRPDDVLNTVGCIWAKYLILNAEKFRRQFVTHEGKKELTYVTGGTYSTERVPEVIKGLLKLVNEDQDSDKLGWLNADFSTSTDLDKLVRVSALLASQKEYYKYSSMFCCGFSEVTLMGSEEDWDLLVEKIRQMPELDDQIGIWRETLSSTITQMRKGSEDFWNNAITRSGGGSGRELSD